MKILHTIAWIDKTEGGPSSSTYELARALNLGGVTTDILALAPKAPATEVVNEADFVKLLPDDAFPYSISRNFHRELRTRYNSYDLYHVNGLWLYPNYDTVQFCRARHLPYVITPHGMLYPVALSVKKTAKKILRKLFFDAALLHAACIHVTCDEELKHYRELGFTNPVAVIPNCLGAPENIAALRAPQSRKKRIVFLGRLHPIKNIDLMLKAWARTQDSDDAEFVLAGNGDARYWNYLQSLAQSLRLTNVIFAGFITGDAKFRLLADARAVVLASKMESFGMTVPEALMVGTPALTGNHTPWSALSANKCGWNIPTDEKHLAKAFSDILSMPESEIQAMGNAGIRYFEANFTAAANAGKMAALYRWILTQGDRPDFVSIG